jgi:hypothetical protein
MNDFSVTWGLFKGCEPVWEEDGKRLRGGLYDRSTFYACMKR